MHSFWPFKISQRFKAALALQKVSQTFSSSGQNEQLSYQSLQHGHFAVADAVQGATVCHVLAYHER